MTVEEQKYVTALEEYKQLADEQIKQLNRIIDLKEKMDKSKTELLNQLKEMNISSDNLDWVTEQLDQTIDEEIEEQAMIDYNKMEEESEIDNYNEMNNEQK